MRTIPCDYIEARSNSSSRLFWVKFHFLVEPDGKVHSFLHRSDAFDNLEFAKEAGVQLYYKTMDFLASPDFLSVLYSQILDYEKYVSESGAEEKPKQKYTFTKH